MLKNKSIKLFFKITLGASLFLWMAHSLYHQIRLQPKLGSTINDIFSVWNTPKLLLLAGVVMLMLANWTVEAAKWRLQLRNTESLTLWQSFQSVLTGVAISLLTPNRIGEYVGRILYLKNEHKLQGITVTIVGSFAQLIVAALMGLIGFLYYVINISNAPWLVVVMIGHAIVCAVLTYTYFNLAKIVEWTSNIAFLRKIRVYIEIVRRFDRNMLNKILGYSLFRYLVYSAQFVILMKLMLVDAAIVDLTLTVWLIYWFMAVVPTIAIAELGIRGETALFFLAPLSTNHFGIVTSSLLLWLINLIIPALLGCLFVFKMKIYNDE